MRRPGQEAAVGIQVRADRGLCWRGSGGGGEKHGYHMGLEGDVNMTL